MRVSRPLPLLLFAAALSLSACESAEERAESHYQRAMALIAEGDVERAVVEFRNVFQLNGDHGPARLEYAGLLRAQGDPRGAIAQYLRLVEQDPQNLDGHLALGELAFEVADFETAETHINRAFALAPADPAVRAMKASIDFRNGEQAAALAMAEGVLAEDPGNVPANMVAIAERMAARDFRGALARADAALEAAPADETLHLARLAALEQAGDTAATGAQLGRMAELFPENEGVSQALIQWHLRRGDAEGAEKVLRAIAARDPENPDGALAVAQFLLESAGPAAARPELERLAAEAADPRPFEHALARLDFAQGEHEAAIAAMRELVEGRAPSDPVRDMQTELARMLAQTGQTEEAGALIDTVLESDRAEVAALKLRARMRIDADRPAEAIADMRTALAEAPNDAEILTIMALAHEREGSRDLMGERLALAVETSGYGAEEAIRYAEFLLEEGRPGPAESVLGDALRHAPRDPDLLAALGDLHLARQDWARARQVADLLRELGGETAAGAAAGLELASLRGEGRMDETLAMLEDLARSEAGGPIALIQAQLEAGDLEAARTRIEELLAEDPASPAGRMMQAALNLLEGDTQKAEALYRALAAEIPSAPEPHRALVALLIGQGRDGDAAAAIEAGLAATGGDPELTLAQAGLREASNDFEGAIAAYEELYAAESANPLLANNLASLLASHRTDPESLERAFAIARRLRGSDVPQFKDTYGWILHRRGDPEGALGYLDAAAAALENDPLVQFHLGMTYLALERREEGRAALERAVKLAGEGSGLPQIAEARARLAELNARPAAASGG